ncbi:hypothetical protein ACQKWADRAFT_325220 [Trichoderma austrokoningii]
MDTIDPIDQDELDIDFFANTSVTRQTCDDWLRRRFPGRNFRPIPEQGSNSYSVYTGQDEEHVVQFRLKTYPLDVDAINWTRQVHGDKVPVVVFEGQLGEDGTAKPPLLAYSIDVVRGTPYSSFLRYRGDAMRTSRDMNATCRRKLTRDFARFFASSWNSPRQVSAEERAWSKTQHVETLQSLSCLPEEFHPIIRVCISQMDAIMRLPMVVYHTELSGDGFAVDQECHLVGILNWSKLATGPFGLNLHMLEYIYGDFSLRYGRSDFFDHEDLHCLFWDTLSRSVVGGLTEEETSVVKMAMIVGFLLHWGLAWKAASDPSPEPGSVVDQISKFNLSVLKWYLVDTTRFEGIKELLESPVEI